MYVHTNDMLVCFIFLDPDPCTIPDFLSSQQLNDHSLLKCHIVHFNYDRHTSHVLVSVVCIKIHAQYSHTSMYDTSEGRVMSIHIFHFLYIQLYCSSRSQESLQHLHMNHHRFENALRSRIFVFCLWYPWLLPFVA